MRIRLFAGLAAMAAIAATMSFVHTQSADHWPATAAAPDSAAHVDSIAQQLPAAPAPATQVPFATIAFATVIGSTVRAKVRCNSKSHTPGQGTSLSFGAVYSNDPNSENKSFTDATPNLSLSMSISDGKPAADSFEQGKEYYLDFTPAS